MQKLKAFKIFLFKNLNYVKKVINKQGSKLLSMYGPLIAQNNC